MLVSALVTRWKLSGWPTASFPHTHHIQPCKLFSLFIVHASSSIHVHVLIAWQVFHPCCWLWHNPCWSSSHENFIYSSSEFAKDVQLHRLCGLSFSGIWSIIPFLCNVSHFKAKLDKHTIVMVEKHAVYMYSPLQRFRNPSVVHWRLLGLRLKDKCEKSSVLRIFAFIS